MSDPDPYHRGFVIVSLGGEGDCTVEGQRYCILRVQGPYRGHRDGEADFRAAQEAGEHPHWITLSTPDSVITAGGCQQEWAP